MEEKLTQPWRGRDSLFPDISSYFFEQIIELQNNFSSQSWVNLDETELLRCDDRICLTFPSLARYGARQLRLLRQVGLPPHRERRLQ